MLALAALPMFYMELVLGQFSQLGPNKVFGKLAPAFRGLGYGMLCVTMWVALYYNVIIAWAFFYTFASLTSRLPWADCDNWFNSPDCFLPERSRECEALGLVWWNSTCTAATTFCTAALHLPGLHNATHCLGDAAGSFGPVGIATARHGVSPAEEYFRNYMLLMEEDTSLDNLGSMNWRLVGCLALSWIICLACLIRGVKSCGKVVWFTAIFPYIVLILLFIRGVTLPGAMTGIEFYVSPNWSKLLSVHVSSPTVPSPPPRSGLTQPRRSSTPSVLPSGWVPAPFPIHPSTLPPGPHHARLVQQEEPQLPA
jgi:solute carrier family 6 amino acid transporter-like protein 5/7/9/14